MLGIIELQKRLDVAHKGMVEFNEGLKSSKEEYDRLKEIYDQLLIELKEQQRREKREVRP
jgi:putative ubiquitin-RnfH superfamily antitoxin RatB of RatAB toxin-antitoxin module